VNTHIQEQFFTAITAHVMQVLHRLVNWQCGIVR